ncbi:hypothetical protein I5677_16775 [Mobilitalea sibirica]|uniref:S-layer protein SbsC C-terminal domain-containing protein n=1 Tax=Mobilitalea sibirica TaxID=1462919 RepID=A0A8J7L3G3_9FIRM|nr:hypothetical protein [Mobilitalea sibirica]MBH1942548.1 hypothetical protein [Mobilitalea sibirica]
MMRMKKLMIKALMTSLIINFGIFFFTNAETIYAAATPVTINTVDFEDENIIVNNNGNSKIYFATESEAAKDRWDVMPADTGATSEIDFSWVSPTSDNVIKIKGDVDPTQQRVVLPERTKKLEISINYSKMSSLAKDDPIAKLLNIMSTSGTGANPIDFNDLEWKKGESGKWKDINELTKGQLEKYQIRGTYIYFRIMAVNDETSATNPSPDGSKGRRVSDEVKLKIAKKATAMVVGIDGEEFTANIRYGKEYRVTVDGVGPTDWIKVMDRSVRELPLATIANDGSNGTTIPFKNMFLEIRDYSTARTASSKITEIELDDQRTLTNPIVEGDAPDGATAADPNIYVSYNGVKNMVITIPSASKELPYEYCVVKSGDFFELDRVRWSSITKNTPVKILTSKAVEGGTLYVRQKEIKSKEATRYTPAVAYALASTYVTHTINYPSIPETDKATYTFVKQTGDTVTFDIKLNVLGKKPFETDIKTIKLGTKELGYTRTYIPVTPDPNNTTIEYVMRVTLNSADLENMTNTYNRALSLYYMNGTIDKYTVKLTIKNRTPAYALTVDIQPGTAGATQANVVSTVPTGNELVYTITDAEIVDKYMEEIIPVGSADAFTNGQNIPITANRYLTIYEINSTTRNIVKYRSIQITAGDIG